MRDKLKKYNVRLLKLIPLTKSMQCSNLINQNQLNGIIQTIIGK